MSVSHRRRVAVAAVLIGLLTGCGAGGPSATGPDATPGAATRSVPPSADSRSVPPSADNAVELPWPAPGAADSAVLQAAVDRGSQPWLLDPSDVALSYVAAAHAWTGAEATPGPAGGEADRMSIEVRAADGRRLALTLAQPGRLGPTGIWVVTAERPA